MKVKKTKTKPVKKTKKETKSEKPWVKVLDMNVNPDNPRNFIIYHKISFF